LTRKFSASSPPSPKYRESHDDVEDERKTLCFDFEAEVGLDEDVKELTGDRLDGVVVVAVTDER
jgi:hypothetical protein